MSEQWSRLFAFEYARWLAEQLTAELGWCSERTIYAAWNAGLTRVVSVKGDITRLNDMTQEKCDELDSHRYAIR